MLHLLPSHYKRFYIFQMIVLITMIIAGSVIFSIVLAVHILLSKVHKLLCKAIITNLCYSLWIHFTFIAQWWSGLRLRIFTDDETFDKFGKEHVLAIMNHKYDIDWITCWLFAERFGGLGGAQSFSKSSLRYIPIIGWIWNFNGTIFLNRDWVKDKEVIKNSLKGFTETMPGYYNMLLLYPEGTRFNQTKLEASNEIARSKGMKELKHCLLPRAKGFVEMIRHLRPQIDVIYDFTVGFPDSVDPSVEGVNTNQPGLTMKNLLNAYVKKGDIACERIPMKDLPEDDEELALWLQDAFRRKDVLFEHYAKTGSFPGPHKVIHPPKRGLIVYYITFLLVWTLVGGWLGHVLWTSSWMIRSTIVGIILTILFLIQFTMKIIQKGSSYGIKEKST